MNILYYYFRSSWFLILKQFNMFGIFFYSLFLLGITRMHCFCSAFAV